MKTKLGLTYKEKKLYENAYKYHCKSGDYERLLFDSIVRRFEKAYPSIKNIGDIVQDCLSSMDAYIISESGCSNEEYAWKYIERYIEKNK